MDDNMRSIFLMFTCMHWVYWNIMKKIEEMESKMETFCNDLVGNATTAQHKIVQTQPMSAMRKTSGTHPSKTTHFQLDVESETEDGISEMEDIHCECIQENLECISEDINLQRSYLLDELTQNGCLTENEATEIRDFPKRKNQNRKLATTIAKRSRVKFSSFVEVMKRTENYPHIAEKLESSYKARTEEFRKRQECVHCYIIRNVNMSDIIEPLCSQKIVSLDFLDKVISCCENDTEKLKKLWGRLFSLINHSEDERSREVFKESLRKKYEHISKKIDAEKYIKCRCRRSELERMSWPSGSYTTEERSTTSTPALPWSQVSSKSAVSTMSEGLSEASDLEIGDYSNLPRTLRWVESISKDGEVDVLDENREAVIEYSHPETTDVDQASDAEPVMEKNDKMEESTRTLVEIGDDFLLKTALLESCMKQNVDRNGFPDGHDVAIDEKSFHNFKTSQSGQSTGDSKSKSSKKKKKKRKKSRTEITTKEEDSQCDTVVPEVQYEVPSPSENLTGSQRTIGDRLFSNIPTIDCTGECSKMACSNSSVDQSPLSSPTILTPSRHVEPLEKVGCCHKQEKPNSKAKKKHKH